MFLFTRRWIGTLDGFVNADVRAQVTGLLGPARLQGGAFVNKGQLLFEIDPRPLSGGFRPSQGRLLKLRRQLANAEAVQVRTQLDVERYAPAGEGAGGEPAGSDNATQNSLAAKATVATAPSPDRDGGGCPRNGELNLDFTRLTAPISGMPDSPATGGALVTTSALR